MGLIIYVLDKYMIDVDIRMTYIFLGDLFVGVNPSLIAYIYVCICAICV